MVDPFTQTIRLSANIIFKPHEALEHEMPKTTLPVFQNTLQKSEEWLHEIMNLLDWEDQKQAYKALRAVFHTLRDRLTIQEASDLAVNFPCCYADCTSRAGLHQASQIT